MRINKKKILILATPLLIIALFIGIHLRGKSEKTHWVKASTGTAYSTVYGLGTVTSDDIYTLHVGTTSSVKKLFVHQGDEVSKGDPLASFIDLVLARAPFSGTVVSLSTHKGETVDPQSKILTIKSMKNRYILVSLEQQGALFVKKGQTVIINIENLRGKKIRGWVEDIYPNNNSFYVKVGVKNLPPNIIPEMTADIAIVTKKQENATKIPIGAVHNHVVIKREGLKKIPVTITLGAKGGSWVQVTSGNIHPGDTVLVRT